MKWRSTDSCSLGNETHYFIKPARNFLEECVYASTLTHTLMNRLCVRFSKHQIRLKIPVQQQSANMKPSDILPHTTFFLFTHNNVCHCFLHDEIVRVYSIYNHKTPTMPLKGLPGYPCESLVRKESYYVHAKVNTK